MAMDDQARVLERILRVKDHVHRSVREYTALGNTYKELNRALRDRQADKLTLELKGVMKGLLEAYTILDQHTVPGRQYATLYRGLRMEQLPANDTFEDLGFVSLTAVKEVAEDFAMPAQPPPGMQGLMMEVHLLPDVRYALLPLGYVSSLKKEYEVVAKPGAIFHLCRKEARGDVTHATYVMFPSAAEYAKYEDPCAALKHINAAAQARRSPNSRAPARLIGTNLACHRAQATPPPVMEGLVERLVQLLAEGRPCGDAHRAGALVDMWMEAYKHAAALHGLPELEAGDRDALLKIAEQRFLTCALKDEEEEHDAMEVDMANGGQEDVRVIIAEPNTRVAWFKQTEYAASEGTNVTHHIVATYETESKLLDREQDWTLQSLRWTVTDANDGKRVLEVLDTAVPRGLRDVEDARTAVQHALTLERLLRGKAVKVAAGSQNQEQLLHNASGLAWPQHVNMARIKVRSATPFKDGAIDQWVADGTVAVPPALASAIERALSQGSFRVVQADGYESRLRDLHVTLPNEGGSVMVRFTGTPTPGDNVRGDNVRGDNAEDWACNGGVSWHLQAEGLRRTSQLMEGVLSEDNNVVTLQPNLRSHEVVLARALVRTVLRWFAKQPTPLRLQVLQPQRATHISVMHVEQQPTVAPGAAPPLEQGRDLEKCVEGYTGKEHLILFDDMYNVVVLDPSNNTLPEMDREQRASWIMDHVGTDDVRLVGCLQAQRRAYAVYQVKGGDQYDIYGDGTNDSQAGTGAWVAPLTLIMHPAHPADAVAMREVLKLPPISTSNRRKAAPRAVLPDAWFPLTYQEDEVEVVDDDLGGSTGAQKVKVMVMGKEQYYVRKMSGNGVTAAHLREEHVANRLYMELGAVVPAARLYTLLDGEVVRLSAFLPNTRSVDLRRDRVKLCEHFLADALLANWDVIGMDEDNVLVYDGVPVRVDCGGSLRFRAQGGRKGNAFGNAVTEIKSMRCYADFEPQPLNCEYFTRLTKQDIYKQAQVLVPRAMTVVKLLIDDKMLDKDLAVTLVARLKWLAKTFKL